MRRLAMLAAVALLGLTMATMASAQGQSAQPDRPPPGYDMGPGPGWGMRPAYGWGMGRRYAWGGHHRHGRSGAWGWGWRHRMGWVLSQLPADKRAQLRDFSFSMRRQMIGKRAKLEEARLDLIQAMSKDPVDKLAAQHAYEHMAKVRGEMFQLRLTAMLQVQQIIGKTLWDEMAHGGYGAANGPGPAGGVKR